MLREAPTAAFDRIWKTRPLGPVVEFTIDASGKASTGQTIGAALPADAQLLRASNAPEVFLVLPRPGKTGVRRHVADEAQLRDMFQTFDNVSVVADMAAINQYALGLPLSPEASAFEGVTKHDVYTYAGADGAEHVCALVLPADVYAKAGDADVCYQLVSDEIYARFKDDFDFIMLVSGGAQPVFGMSSNRGAAGLVQKVGRITPSKLRALMTLKTAKNLYNGAFLHEVAHTWAQRIVTTWGYRQFVAGGPFFKAMTGEAPRNYVQNSATGKWEKKKPRDRYKYVPNPQDSREPGTWQDLDQPAVTLDANIYSRWGAAPVMTVDEPNWDGGADGGHWGISSANGELGGYTAVTQETAIAGTARVACKAAWFGYNNTGANAREYSDIELWLMGLATRAEIDALKLDVWEQVADYQEAGSVTSWSGVKKTYTSADLQALKTVAPLDAAAAKPAFNILTVIVSDHIPSADEWAAADQYIRWFVNPDSDDSSALPDKVEGYQPKNFATATRKRAGMNARISGWPHHFHMR
jgi:hypothetical protein